MRLWTLQDRQVLDILAKDGVYRTDEALIDMPEFFPAYDWLCEKLNAKTPKPTGVKYPVWAWFRYNNKEKKPDLRQSGHGTRGAKMVCIELEIPDEYVLLSDFDLWHFVLNNWWLDDSKTEEEWDQNHDWFDQQDQETRQALTHASWEKIFNIEYFESDWIAQGKYVQAVFWQLRKEWVVKTQNFIAR